MKLKVGVRLMGLSSQMAVAFAIVGRVCDDFGIECVITSANDSKHGAASLHYDGCALDFRTKFPALDGREVAFRDAVQEALGPEFDVVLEAVGTDNEHLHVEYDPKA